MQNAEQAKRGDWVLLHDGDLAGTPSIVFGSRADLEGLAAFLFARPEVTRVSVVTREEFVAVGGKA